MSVHGGFQLAAVILAAGESRRFGSAKALLQWENDNFVNTLVRKANLAGYFPVITVLGANHSQILEKLTAETVVVINDRWAEGQSTSIRAGLTALPESVEGALFMLCDQPQLSLTFLDALREAARSSHKIVRPYFGGTPGNPVYFPREAFPLLETLTGDQGGRAVMDQFRSVSLEWIDETMGLDADTPDQYLQLRHLYGLEQPKPDGV